MEQEYKDAQRLSNSHIVLWLFKDACWISDFKLLGTLLILPTVAMAIYITYRFWYNLSERYHNLAVLCWICANGTWMIGEFYYNYSIRPLAQVFFILGITILQYYYLWVRVKHRPKTEL